MGAVDASLGPAPAGEAAAGSEATATPTPTSPTLGLVEVLDRDGQPRQSLAVRRWPVRIGRALDNDLVLGDPHVAAHHLRLAVGAGGGLELEVGATRNGLLVGGGNGRRRLAGDSRTVLPPAGAEPLELTLGRTVLRLRLASQPVAAERPLATRAEPLRPAPLVALAAMVLGELVAGIWLSSEPEGFVRAATLATLSGVAGALLWCGAWALATKTFAGRARFGWHLRVFLVASVALAAVSVLPDLAAFAFSWPWASGYAFVAKIAVAAAAIYFHLLAVEPARPRALRAATVGLALAGIAVACGFNAQRLDRLGDELYMSHLFPPALRLARPVPVGTLVERLGELKEPLDRKAREAGDPAGNDDEGGADDAGR